MDGVTCRPLGPSASMGSKYCLAYCALLSENVFNTSDLLFILSSFGTSTLFFFEIVDFILLYGIPGNNSDYTSYRKLVLATV